jgi:hypothetical protein
MVIKILYIEDVKKPSRIQTVTPVIQSSSEFHLTDGKPSANDFKSGFLIGLCHKKKYA